MCCNFNSINFADLVTDTEKQKDNGHTVICYKVVRLDRRPPLYTDDQNIVYNPNTVVISNRPQKFLSSVEKEFCVCEKGIHVWINYHEAGKYITSLHYDIENSYIFHHQYRIIKVQCLRQDFICYDSLSSSAVFMKVFVLT